MIARLYPNFETNALILHSTNWPAVLLVLVRGLDSVNFDRARHAEVIFGLANRKLPNLCASVDSR
jgi:hypothetical protein